LWNLRWKYSIRRSCHILWGNDWKKNEKQNRLENEKYTIGIVGLRCVLCSDRCIEDTDSHRLKITKRDRKTHHHVRQSWLHCIALACSRIRGSSLLFTRCLQRLRPAGWKEREWGTQREREKKDRLRDQKRRERETDQNPTLLGRISDVSLEQVVWPVRDAHW